MVTLESLAVVRRRTARLYTILNVYDTNLCCINICHVFRKTIKSNKWRDESLLNLLSYIFIGLWTYDVILISNLSLSAFLFFEKKNTVIYFMIWIFEELWTSSG